MERAIGWHAPPCFVVPTAIMGTGRGSRRRLERANVQVEQTLRAMHRRCRGSSTTPSFLRAPGRVEALMLCQLDRQLLFPNAVSTAGRGAKYDIRPWFITFLFFDFFLVSSARQSAPRGGTCRRKDVLQIPLHLSVRFTCRVRDAVTLTRKRVNPWSFGRGNQGVWRRSAALEIPQARR